jgi:hypothetical protein
VVRFTTFPPEIKGVPIIGKTLEASTGSWRNAPTKFAYQLDAL